MFKFRLNNKDRKLLYALKFLSDKTARSIVKKLDSNKNVYTSKEKSLMCVFAHEMSVQFETEDKIISKELKKLWLKLKETKDLNNV
jgi:hypothetical protein